MLYVTTHRVRSVSHNICLLNQPYTYVGIYTPYSVYILLTYRVHEASLGLFTPIVIFSGFETITRKYLMIRYPQRKLLRKLFTSCFLRFRYVFRVLRPVYWHQFSICYLKRSCFLPVQKFDLNWMECVEIRMVPGTFCA